MRLFLILAFLAACTHPSFEPGTYTNEPDPRHKEVVLGVGDVVSINVWGEKDLNTDATIRPDGTITMPLVGDLPAAGLTPSALKAKIKEGLDKFLKLQAGNEVTVAIKSWKSYRFTLEGEVGKPGVFTSDQYVRVSEAVAMAGGLTRFAKRDGVILLRPDAKGNVRQIPLDYDQLASGKRLDMNIFVLPGDTIWVP
jgi:polysaccharide export outer membrane protein